MKKVLMLLLVVVSLFSLAACGTEEQPAEEQLVEEQPTEEPAEEPAEEQPAEEQPAEEAATEEPEEPATEEPTADGQSAYALYVKANEALEAADSLRMNVKTTMTMEVDGMSETIMIAADAEQVFKSPTEIDMKMNMTMDFMGESMETLMYYKDGMSYMEMYGMKVKQPMDVEEASQQASTDTIAFSEEAIKQQSVNEVSGNREITFTLDGAALSGEMLDQMNSIDSDTAATAGAAFGDIELKVIIDSSDNMKTFHLSCPYEMSESGYVITGDMEIEMEVLQIGGVTIDFPTDLDTYQELDELQESES